jgi:hypothetical protein
MQALDIKGIKASDISLIKRKGRIRIELAGENVYFEFFKRKSVQISDDKHQWERSEHFEIKTQSQALTVGDWEDVVKKLKAWRDNILK